MGANKANKKPSQGAHERPLLRGKKTHQELIFVTLAASNSKRDVFHNTLKYRIIIV